MAYVSSLSDARSWIFGSLRYGHRYPESAHRLVVCAEIKPLNGWRRVRVYCACGAMWNMGFALPLDCRDEPAWIDREAADAVTWHAAHTGDPIYQGRWVAAGVEHYG